MTDIIKPSQAAVPRVLVSHLYSKLAHSRARSESLRSRRSRAMTYLAMHKTETGNLIEASKWDLVGVKPKTLEDAAFILMEASKSSDTQTHNPPAWMQPLLQWLTHCQSKAKMDIALHKEYGKALSQGIKKQKRIDRSRKIDFHSRQIKMYSGVIESCQKNILKAESEYEKKNLIAEMEGHQEYLEHSKQALDKLQAEEEQDDATSN